jgi:hypothetical protein
MAKNKQTAGQRSNLITLDQFAASTDPRAPKADITNAPHLFGDPNDYEDGDAYGDSAYGDSAYGDSFGPESIYGGAMNVGDPSSAGLDTYAALIGAPKWVKPAAMFAGAAGLAAGTAALIKRAQRRKAQANAVRNVLARNASRNTITNSILARRLMGRIPKNTPFQFYSVMGATLNQYPIAPTELFPADSLKYNMDRQASDTPFEVEIAPGAIVGPNLVATATGVATNRFFAGIIVTVGINALAANPGTVMNITATIPTINGSLVIAANPFSFTIGKDYYTRFIIYPWQLVTNKPVLALGSYSNANPIIVTVSGVPTSSSVTLIVPGSMHQWTIAMRNRLV